MTNALMADSEPLWVFVSVTTNSQVMVPHQFIEVDVESFNDTNINRRQTRMKILYFDLSGYCIWMKKLEQGRFQYPVTETNKALLDRTQLTLVLEGIDLNKIHQNKRYKLVRDR